MQHVTLVRTSLAPTRTLRSEAMHVAKTVRKGNKQCLKVWASPTHQIERTCQAQATTPFPILEREREGEMQAIWPEVTCSSDLSAPPSYACLGPRVCVSAPDIKRYTSFAGGACQQTKSTHVSFIQGCGVYPLHNVVKTLSLVRRLSLLGPVSGVISVIIVIITTVPRI